MRQRSAWDHGRGADRVPPFQIVSLERQSQQKQNQQLEAKIQRSTEALQQAEAREKVRQGSRTIPIAAAVRKSLWHTHAPGY